MIYDISCKTLFDSKPLRIRFGKIDGFIGIYDETRYLTLFDSEEYEAIYKLKASYSHYFAKIKVDSYDFLLTEKIMILHNVKIHTKSILNKGKIHYCYQIFSEKFSYQLAIK